MKLKIYHIIIALIFLAANSCTYDKIPVSPGSGIIRGMVIDAMTGPTMLMSTPMEGADVYTYPKSAAGISDEDGLAFLENIPIGWYNVIAAKKGYYTSYYNTEVLTNKISEVMIFLRPVVTENAYPDKPSNPFPKDNMKIYSNYISLEWVCTDPDGDFLYFDVFFGKDNPPMQLVKFNHLDKLYQIDTLDASTTYYWRISAKDFSGAITEGDIWSFKTK